MIGSWFNRRPGRTPLSSGQKVWLALAMTYGAGYVDAVGYLTLDSLFTSNMTGNAVVSGFQMAERHWFEVWRRGWPVLMFLAGALIASLLVETARRLGLRSLFAIPFGIEAACIFLFIVSGTPVLKKSVIAPLPGIPFFALVALLAIAMGIQNATIRRAGGRNVHTTHITGSLTLSAEHISTSVVWFFDSVRRPDSGGLWNTLYRTAAEPAFRAGIFFAALCIAFVAGATSGGVLRLVWGLWALAPACALAVFACAVDVIRPIASGQG